MGLHVPECGGGAAMWRITGVAHNTHSAMWPVASSGQGRVNALRQECANVSGQGSANASAQGSVSASGQRHASQQGCFAVEQHA